MNNFNKFIKNYSIIIALFSFPNLIYGMEQAQEKDQFNNEIFSPMDKEAYNLILAINDESDIEKLDTSRDVKEALYSFYGEIDEINKADGFFFKNALLSILQRYKRKPNKAIRNKHRKEALVNSLITSCDQGYMNIAKFILFLGADVNRIDNCNGSALMYAAAAGKTQAVKLLLRAGADTNLKNVYQSSALSYAIEKNHFEVVELLIQNGAHVNDPVRKIYHPYYAPPPAIQ